MKLKKKVRYEIHLRDDEIDRIIEALIESEDEQSEMTKKLIEASNDYGY